LPCEHIPVGAKELDERVFLFRVQTSPDDDFLVRILQPQVDALCFFYRLDVVVAWLCSWYWRLHGRREYLDFLTTGFYLLIFSCG